VPTQQGTLTWGDVKSSIALRLNRPTIPPAFIQLIAEERAYELASEGYWPQQQTNTALTTEPGQYFYPLPFGTVDVTFIRFLLTSVFIPVYKARRYEDILISDPTSPPFTAIPSSARVFGRMLRLFPTPNGQYPLELTLNQQVGIPTDDQDTQNFWVNEGRALIVHMTCQHLAQELIRDPDRATMFEGLVQKDMDSLAEISHSRNGPHYMERH
jgi:hypothetical protein